MKIMRILLVSCSAKKKTEMNVPALELIVPLWLSAILNVPYWTLASSLFVGQAISAYTLGMYIIKSDWIERFFQRNSGKRP